jgi:predicted MFS family arabinose efflux permease
MGTSTSDQATPTSDGILVTWRETPLPAKALIFGVFVNRLAAFIQIFLVLFLTQRGFSPAQAGLALGVYGAGAVLGTLVGGMLTDRLNPRAVTLISMVGSGLLILSILYLPYYPLILLAVLLVSAVGVLFRPAAQTMVTGLIPASRLVMVTAMYRLSLNIGSTAAPLIGAAMVAVSYNLLFWGEATAAFIYAVIAIVALPNERTATTVPSPEPTDIDVASPDVATPAAPATPQPPARSRNGYLAMLGDWRYCTFLVAVFLISAVYCQYVATLPLAITGAGLSLWWYSAVVALNGFIVITCELLMTKVVQTWPLTLTLFLGFAPVAVGYGVYTIGMVPVVLVLGTLIWTAAEIIGAPTTFAYPGMVAPAHMRGRYIGAMQSSFGLGAAIGPVVGVLAWNHAGQGVWLWIALVAALATGTALVAARTSAFTRPVAAATTS